jgi:hypothetical protein
VHHPCLRDRGGDGPRLCQSGGQAGASPQTPILRVEEKTIIENAMGQDVVQLRWRLANLEEAKEVVVCRNARKI